MRECRLGTCRKSKHIVIGVEACEIQRITFTYLLKSICPYCAHLFKRQIMNDISQRVIPVITRTGNKKTDFENIKDSGECKLRGEYANLEVHKKVLEQYR